MPSITYPQDVGLNWMLTGCFALLCTYIVSSLLITYFSLQARYLRSQEWTGIKKGWFSSLKASLDSFKGGREMVIDGYNEFSRKGLAYVLPQLGSDGIMILPPTQLKELMQRPDEELSTRAVLVELIAAKWTGDMDVAAHNPYHLDVVRHQLTRKLPTLTEHVYTELVLGFQEQWKATSHEWTDLVIWDTVVRIVSRAANRVFSGTELCREQEFLDSMREYAQRTFMTGAIINITPWWLRPFTAPFLTRQSKPHIKTCKKYALPIIERRLREIQSGQKRDPPNDAIEWILEEAFKQADTSELNPMKICRRLMRLNMVAIHTTSFTISNTLLDLYSSPKSAEFVSELREEVAQVMHAHDNKWTKAAVNDLVKFDSAIKESMRLSLFGNIGALRAVVKPGGITLNDGTHIPQGVKVGFPAAAVHSDPEYYKRPEGYDAFRFARVRETFNEKGQVLDKKQQGLVSTGENFMSFGAGRHACPGRFFAAQELKLMLAYIVHNYDVRLPGPRPPMVYMKNGAMPDLTARLQIRLRQL